MSNDEVREIMDRISDRAQEDVARVFKPGDLTAHTRALMIQGYQLGYGCAIRDCASVPSAVCTNVEQ